MRGEKDLVGTERVRQNGYIEVKTEDGWVQKQRMLAEEMLGRPLKDERVTFKDGDKTNFDFDNLVVKPIGNRSHSRKNAMRELQIVRKHLENLSRRLDELEERYDVGSERDAD
jgi:hypothetical protein